MIHRYAFEASDRMLRDLMKAVDQSLEKKPFGGKVVVFGDDFHQIFSQSHSRTERKDLRHIH